MVWTRVHATCYLCRAWDQINVGSAKAGLALSGPFRPGGLLHPAWGHLHGAVTAMGSGASRDGADATLALRSPVLCRDVWHRGQGWGWGFGDGLIPNQACWGWAEWEEVRTIAGAVRMPRDLEKWGAGRVMLWGRAERKDLISQLGAEQGRSVVEVPVGTDVFSSARLWRCIDQHGAAIRIPEQWARSQPAEKLPSPNPARHQHRTTVLQMGLGPTARQQDGSPDLLSALGCCTSREEKLKACLSGEDLSLSHALIKLRLPPGTCTDAISDDLRTALKMKGFFRVKHCW